MKQHNQNDADRAKQVDSRRNMSFESEIHPSGSFNKYENESDEEDKKENDSSMMEDSSIENAE